MPRRVVPAALQPLRACSTASAAAVEEPASDADDDADEADDADSEPPLRFTSDMRPPKDSSRKWVKMDSLGRAYATGRRKKSVARVWVWPVKGGELPDIRINKAPLSQFFGGHWDQRYAVLAPFYETGTAGKYSVMATVRGGGTTGSAEAVRLGVATALQGLDPGLRPDLKEAGFLTRDPRQRERKKPGQKGARKKFAWVKR